MARSLQTVNKNNRLMEWAQLMEACRSSGLSVRQWCEENGIPPTTYYTWQRRVFAACAESQEQPFVEIAAPKHTSSQTVVAALEVAGLRIEVYPGADATTLHAVFQAAKSC